MYRFQLLITSLGKLLQSEKVQKGKKNQRKNHNTPPPPPPPQILSKHAPLIISNLQRFPFWQQKSENTSRDIGEEQRLGPQHWACVYRTPANSAEKLLPWQGGSQPGHLSPFFVTSFCPKVCPTMGAQSSASKCPIPFGKFLFVFFFPLLK